MTDTIRSAQDDLAFMKAVAEDRGPLPPLLGAHIFAVGLIFGLNLLYIWASLLGVVPWPAEWLAWSWAPGAIGYAPVAVVLSLRSRGVVLGPAARVFAAAWSAVALMTFTIVAVVIIAGIRLGEPIAEVWPPLAFALYGGAWTVMSIAQRKGWAFLVAAGCYAAAIVCASLVGTNELWLAMGIGLLLLLAVPGFAMTRARKPAQELS